MGLFGRRRKELKADIKILKTKLGNSKRRYEELHGEYEKYKETHTKPDASVNATRDGLMANFKGLETQLEDSRKKVENLEARLKANPNQELITKEAILSLAKERSDQGYDAYVRNLITKAVEKGIHAYLRTIAQDLPRVYRTIEPKDITPPRKIEDLSIYRYIGLNLFTTPDLPVVNFIGYTDLDLTTAEETFDETILEQFKEEYKPSTKKDENVPHFIEIRNRTEGEYRDHPNARKTRRHYEYFDPKTKKTINLSTTQIPEEWLKTLQEESHLLLQAYAFGYVASYHNDIQTNPKFSKHINEQHPSIPGRVLKTQERAGLEDNPTLMNKLYQSMQQGEPQFSAAVLNYFKNNS